MSERRNLFFLSGAGAILAGEGTIESSQETVQARKVEWMLLWRSTRHYCPSCSLQQVASEGPPYHPTLEQGPLSFPNNNKFKQQKNTALAKIINIWP